MSIRSFVIKLGRFSEYKVMNIFMNTNYEYVSFYNFNDLEEDADDLILIISILRLFDMIWIRNTF